MSKDATGVMERAGPAAAKTYGLVGAPEETRAPGEQLTEPAEFVGAWGLSPVHELAWAIGLIDFDEPALWEPSE